MKTKISSVGGDRAYQPAGAVSFVLGRAGRRQHKRDGVLAQGLARVGGAQVNEAQNIADRYMK